MRIPFWVVAANICFALSRPMPCIAINRSDVTVKWRVLATIFLAARGPLWTLALVRFGCSTRTVDTVRSEINSAKSWGAIYSRDRNKMTTLLYFYLVRIVETQQVKKQQGTNSIEGLRNNSNSDSNANHIAVSGIVPRSLVLLGNGPTSRPLAC